MKSLIVFILSALTSISYSQDINNLDEKNGFKNLKFGAISSEIEDGLLYSHRFESQKVDVYEYTPAPNSLLTVFNTKFDNLYLLLDDDNKLVGIYLTKNYSSQLNDHYKSALDASLSLIDSYTSVIGKGEYSISTENSSGTYSGLGWKSKKVQLEVKVKYVGFNKDCVLSVQYFSVDHLTTLLDSGY